jgi:predicted porin
MKTKFMSAVAIVALATAAGAVSAEAKSKKSYVAPAPVVDLPVVKGPVVEACNRIGNFAATGDAYAFLTDKCDITWNGITVFGSVDMGFGWMSHGTILEKSVPQGVSYLVTGRSGVAGWHLMPGGLGYSQLGIKGAWTVAEGTKFVFNATTNYDPYTLALLDGPRSLQRAAGKGTNPYTYPYLTNDSSRAGQPFNNELYAGFKNETLGQLTFGRHTSIIAESLANFDPMKSALAFSLLGFSGGYSGGTTEAAKLDNSLKYRVAYGPVYGGAIVTLAESQGLVAGKGVSYGFNLGATYAGFTLDGAYQYTKDAIALGQNGLAFAALTPVNAGWLAGTLSNNSAWSIQSKYVWNQFTGYAGYENIRMTNASDMPLVASTAVSYFDPNGYRYYVSNLNPFPQARNVDLFWTGVSWAYSDKLTLTGAWYHAVQNNYWTTALNRTAANSAGRYDVGSAMAQYAFNKRIQIYGGATFSAGAGGLGAFVNKTDWTTITGLKFTF